MVQLESPVDASDVHAEKVAAGGGYSRSLTRSGGGATRFGTADNTADSLQSGITEENVSHSHKRQRPPSAHGQRDEILISSVESRSETMGASLLHVSSCDGGADREGHRHRKRLREDAAFWLLGLLNNSGYVIMMAVAKEIAPGAVGVVFLADIAPTMMVKLSAPYWFHLVPYSARVWMCSVLMVLALVTVGYGDSTAVQLMGVCFSAVQAGLGESSFLALSAFYDTPRALTAWSSGTGFAGIFGYAWVFLLRSVLGFSFRATLLTASLLALLWLYAYFRLLSPPQASFRVDESIISTTTIGDHTRNGAYSPVSLDNHGCQDIVGADGAGEEDWEGSFGTSIERKISPGDEARAKNMTARERLRFTLGLWRFTVPLMLVYFAEYTMQTGTWSAIGFPVTSAPARRRFYQYANWCYQGGVFCSRSSGLIIRLSPLSLWSLPVVQLVMLFFFYLVAVEQFWYGNSLLILCFGVGLVGGLGYVNAFRLVAEAVPPDLKELALASASVGDSMGVMFSDIFGTFVQACVYKQNGIPGAWAAC